MISFGVHGFGYEIVLSSLLVGVLLVAIISAIEIMRERTRVEQKIRDLANENAELRVVGEHSEALLDADDQITLSWDQSTGVPILIGSLGKASAVPKTRLGFLCFEAWLIPESVMELNSRIESLYESGEPFTIDLITVTRTFIEACGRTSGCRPFVRFRDLSAERAKFAHSRNELRILSNDMALIRRLFEFLPWPVWMREASGRLTSVNPVYAEIVDTSSTCEAVEKQSDLLDTPAGVKLDESRINGVAMAESLVVVAAGERRLFDIIDVHSEHGSIGIAVDTSKRHHLENELKHTMEFHARTLDQLTTAVAIFDSDKKLKFYNAAYLSLWQLDPVFLDSKPSDGSILDELRASRRLPEQSDWRAWRANLLSSYTSLEAQQHWWHLPDGQTLRVVANPYPQGGVAYVYENMTRTLELEAQNNALMWIQRETLDHLSEGVLVFGSDGRLRLWNPKCIELWSLDEQMMRMHPHITEVMCHCDRLYPDTRLWTELTIAVTGLSDTRKCLLMRMDRNDGMVLDVRTVPLPDGGSLIAIANVTDTVNIERALLEKNEALEASNRIKTDFVSLVSYELRSPLTSIVGFAHLLGHSFTGELNDRQSEYVGYIMSSAKSLMTIVDDILDLATVESGTMRLNRAEVDIARAVSVTIDGLHDRIVSADIRVKTNIQDGIGTIWADPQKIRQILFNLLANTLRSSYAGATILVSAWKENEELIFVIAGDTPGTASEEVRNIFENHYASEQGSRYRVDYLGLSLVKSFVGLHGGVVGVVPAEGDRGLIFTCKLPLMKLPSDGRHLVFEDAAG